MKSIFTDNRKLFIFFLILSFLFYGNSLRNDYCFDDSYVAVTNAGKNGKIVNPNNELVAGGIKGIPKIWRSHYGHGKNTAYDYRPIVLTLSAIEFSVFGPKPAVGHFINIVLYAFTGLVLFLLLKKCFGELPNINLFCLLICALFMAHPLHTEVVDSIKSSDELLALLFSLLAALEMIRFFDERNYLRLGWMALYIFIAYYSKITSAIFIILLIPLILFFFRRQNLKLIAGSFVVLVATYFLHNKFNRAVISEKANRIYYHFENPLYTEHLSFFPKILFSLKTFGIYVKLLLFPFPLRYYYGANTVPLQVSLFDAEVITGILFVALAVWHCYKTKDRIAVFGLCFFLLAIVPYCNFNSPVAGIVGERLSYVASIGFCIFIIAVFFHYFRNMPARVDFSVFSKKPLAYFSLLLAVYLIYTWNRNTAWKDEITLFEHDAPYLQNSSGANNLLGNKYYFMYNEHNPQYNPTLLLQNALKYYNMAIALDPSMTSAFNNAGVIYFSYLGQTDRAIEYFRSGIRMNAHFPVAYENLGNAYKKKGDTTEAIKNYRIAISQEKKQYKSYSELIKIFFNKGENEKALELIVAAENVFPKNQQYELLADHGRYFINKGDKRAAAKKYEEAYSLNPNKKLSEYLAMQYIELKDSAKAGYYYTQARLLPQ